MTFYMTLQNVSAYRKRFRKIKVKLYFYYCASDYL
jgi:hypothetical protein